LKNNKHGRISEYTDKFGGEFFASKKPWDIKCDIALPCATQNELNEEDAKTLVKN
jgi:glutamate dehydrogenase/leucine dehydrogenase